MIIELNLEEVNIILESLGEQPLVKVIDVFNKVKSQANAQLKKEKAIHD